MLPKGSLYLLPVPLGDSPPSHSLPAETLRVLATVRCLIAENPRTTRRFLATLPLTVPVQSLRIEELSEHTPATALRALLDPAMEGHDMGLVSEAGCPVVADPGASLVRLAHEAGIRVVPMVGPNAPLLALMASGLTGQQFRFVGYVPQDSATRRQAVASLEREVRATGCTQILIETPYRNLALWETFVETCGPDLTLAVAADLTGQDELILVRSIADWKRLGAPPIQRRPTVFVLGSREDPKPRSTSPAPRPRRLPAR